MKIDVLTLFPEIVTGPLNQSILKRAQLNGLLELNVVNIRDFALDRHKTTDDLPYGGGPGMVMKVEPVTRAVQSVLSPESTTVLLTPGGHRFNQKWARELSGKNQLVFICGHYEGIDERVREIFNPLCLSIGDYVITNGATAACVVIDAVARLLPGVLGNPESSREESFENETVEYPQYTRPREFMGYSVPEILISGNHGEIEKWRREQAEKRTRELKTPESFKEEDDESDN